MAKNKLLKIQRPKDEPVITLSRQNNPVFSFAYLQDNSIKSSQKDTKFLYDFLNHLREISKHSWLDLQKAGKHSLIGYEKLPLSCFVPDIQSSDIMAGVDKLTVFRATGDNRIFAGVRIEDVFYIIFIETKISDIEKH